MHQSVYLVISARLTAPTSGKDHVAAQDVLDAPRHGERLMLQAGVSVRVQQRQARLRLHGDDALAAVTCRRRTACGFQLCSAELTYRRHTASCRITRCEAKQIYHSRMLKEAHYC